MNKINWENYVDNFTSYAKRNGKTDAYIRENLSYAKELVRQNLPIIYDSKHLSLLIGFHNSYFYRVSNSQNKFYRRFQIRKHNGSIRTIHEPLPNLKYIQKWLLENIFHNIKVSRFAKAYIKNTSIKDNVRFHRNQKIVLKLDIKNFFPSIKRKHVYKILDKCGYNSELTKLITELCLVNNKLPQGAPTSAYISNIVLNEFDDLISSYCVKESIRYTRYADDMTFSGDFKIGKLISYVENELSKLNLYINENKTRVLKQNNRQLVTGITVNEKIQVSRSYRKNIRLEMHYINKFGLSGHLNHNNYKGSQIEYVRSLLGKVNYCLFINSKDGEMINYKGNLKNILERL